MFKNVESLSCSTGNGYMLFVGHGMHGYTVVPYLKKTCLSLVYFTSFLLLTNYFFFLAFSEFLNVDDDEVADDDYMPSAEDNRFLENSGWSSRTRCVII